MKVICLISAGTVDECLVMHDDQVPATLVKLHKENDKLDKDERVYIITLSPTDLAGAIEYIKNP